MKTFAELEAQDLQWVRAKTKWWKSASYQLQNTDGEVYAMIHREGWGSKVTVDATGNRWIFERRHGFFKPTRIVITSVGTGEQPAEFIQRGNSGVLNYADGRVFNWKAFGLGMTKWMWTNADQQAVLGIELKGFWQWRGEVRVNPEIAAEKAPPLLLFLGWYLILLAKDDAAAAAATIAATSAG